MTEITVGELLAKCLQAEGIEMMFGIVDGSHIPFATQAPRYGIRHVNCRHEEGAVHLAEGYSRISRKPSVVIGSPGPGGANRRRKAASTRGAPGPRLRSATRR
jgi:acetolactate synthase-1/2/3 large subunit